MSITSQIPALHVGLYNAAFGVLSATTTVVDGPPLSWDPLVVPAPGAASESAYLFIGARPDDDLAADAQQQRTTLGSARTEDINVICTALVKGDEQSLPTTRQAAFNIVGTVEKAIRTDQTLGGAVAWAVLASVDRLDQRQQEDGGYAIVLFTVTGRAFLR
jgi:hypothetical protein